MKTTQDIDQLCQSVLEEFHMIHKMTISPNQRDLPHSVRITVTCRHKKSQRFQIGSLGFQIYDEVIRGSGLSHNEIMARICHQIDFVRVKKIISGSVRVHIYELDPRLKAMIGAS